MSLHPFAFDPVQLAFVEAPPYTPPVQHLFANDHDLHSIEATTFASPIEEHVEQPCVGEILENLVPAPLVNAAMVFRAIAVELVTQSQRIVQLLRHYWLLAAIVALYVISVESRFRALQPKSESLRGTSSAFTRQALRLLSAGLVDPVSSRRAAIGQAVVANTAVEQMVLLPWTNTQAEVHQFVVLLSFLLGFLGRAILSSPSAPLRSSPFLLEWRRITAPVPPHGRQGSLNGPLRVAPPALPAPPAPLLLEWRPMAISVPSHDGQGYLKGLLRLYQSRLIASALALPRQLLVPEAPSRASPANDDGENGSPSPSSSASPRSASPRPRRTHSLPSGSPASAGSAAGFGINCAFAFNVPDSAKSEFKFAAQKPFDLPPPREQRADDPFAFAFDIPSAVPVSFGPILPVPSSDETLLYELYVGGNTYATIAAELSIPQGTVKNKVKALKAYGQFKAGIETEKARRRTNK